MLDGVANINELCSVWRNNYGFAGKIFINYIKTIDKELLIKKYNEYLQQFIKTGGTGKQSMAGAMLMLADELANDCIFKDNLKLTINDFKGIILSETEVSRAERFYDMIFDWIATNKRHFDGTDNVDQWGKIDDANNQVQIIKNVIDTQFFKEVQSKPILTEWLKNKYINGEKDNVTKPLRISGILARVVCVKLKQENIQQLTLINDEDLPF